MSYYFANLRRAKDDPGWEPDLPEGSGFSLIADSRSIKWGLYSCTGEVRPEGHPGVEPVSFELDALLASAERFPPALALAREKVDRLFRTEVPSREEFAAVLIDSLQTQLSRQATSPYILARTVGDEIGYRSHGEWFWLIGILDGDEPMVSWVSDDFFIYQNPAPDFDIDPKHFAALEASRREFLGWFKTEA